MHVNTMRAALTGVRRYHRRVSFGHFFSEGHKGAFLISIKIIDGASDVYSLHRKELFWQCKLGTFVTNGLNERAADIELDMLAFGTARIRSLHLNKSGALPGGHASLRTSCQCARGVRVEFPVLLSRDLAI